MSSFDYRKYEFKRDSVLVDPRTYLERFKDKIITSHTSMTMFGMAAALILLHPWFAYTADVLLFYNGIYFIWLVWFSKTNHMPFRMPKTAKAIDPNYKAPGTGKPRMADGILYLGNEERSSEEIWFTNTDARTHILFLGTTGSGKTEGLKSLASNALGWGSGFIYVDGKADTDLWGTISALARRFGRDDDLLVLNYMTGNSDSRIASNTVNPFAQGSASYLTNLLVSLMPEVQGDNAMWKDRAVALMSALMPVLTWQRTYQEKPLNINVIRDALNFKRVIELARRPEIPDRLRKGLKGYLDTLPGYTDSGFNDDGTEKPNPNGPPMDYSTIYQQHGYLSMQFTRQLQSLADDYGYIFETAAADIDMMDIVLNRRILVVLIPALEKSADETANLGKIVGSMLKGMMGATLGSSVEGDTDLALENKPTRSNTPFMAIFDEVGYYTTQGMAVMAAQARSLGFSLVFAGQDLPALEKRVKEEARSITANCNIKIFGKLEDPTQTKEFFEKTVGEATVVEASTRKEIKAMFGQKRVDRTDNFNVASRAKASYSQLKDFKEGQAIVTFGSHVVQSRLFYSDPGKIKSLRVNKFIPIPHPDPDGKLASKDVDAILERLGDKRWTANSASSREVPSTEIKILASSYLQAKKDKRSLIESGAFAITQFASQQNFLKPDDFKAPTERKEPPKPAVSAPAESGDTGIKATPEDKPLSSQMSGAPAAKAPSAPLQRKEPSVSDPSLEEQAQKGTEDTISWKALLGEEEPAAKTPEAAEPKNVPSTEETVSWKELLGEEKDKPDLRKAIPTPPPGGGFGVSSFGTGFGGIGGLPGMGMAKPPAAVPSADKATPPAEPQKSKEDITKSVEQGETISWKDLI